jgi:hypothetical protein
MQFTFEQRGKQNFIVNTADDGPKVNLRILTEDEIQNMSEGSLRLYRRKVQDIRPLIHNSGTPQSVKSIDYLFHATNRAWTKYADEHHWKWWSQYCKDNGISPRG